MRFKLRSWESGFSERFPKKLNPNLTVGKTTQAGHRGSIPVDLSLLGYDFIQTDTPDLNNIYNEPYLHYSLIDIQDTTVFSGLFGLWKYFEDIKEEL